MACCFSFTCMSVCTSAHDIFFCGERIPLEDKIVAEKMMNIIKKQINYLNLPALKQRIAEYMKRVEYYINVTNIPSDFKYLAIVESGFKTDAASPVGAVGFWQLMPNTAREMNLVVNGTVDERTDFDKSTYAAFRVLAGYYLDIRKTYRISSWVLAAAAYNHGIGNIKKQVRNQGTNYFSMTLNEETAAYVYKIIAVKELFEFPELYMGGFGYNIFSTTPSVTTKAIASKYQTDVSAFRSLKVEVNEQDGLHPQELKKGSINNEPIKDDLTKIKLVSAKIKGSYKHFKDGDIVDIELDADMQVDNRFSAKGNLLQGRAWLIDGRVMVDLGFEHRVTLYDLKNVKGVLLKRLKKNEPVMLKVIK